MFRLSWFVNHGFGVYGWNEKWSGNVRGDVARPDLFMACTQALENAGFDYVMLEDASVIPDTHRGTFDRSLEIGLIRQDPFPLIPLIAHATKHIGIIGTMSTSFYPPYIAARLTNTLDHLTNGRFGVNLVTSSPHAAAQNFGYDQHFEHDLRYEMAGEWVQAVKSLWNTWEPDAVIYDEEHGIFADPSKVHYANFEGRWFKTRGPLNCVPSPQYHPVICQAGASPAGMRFGAENADTIIGGQRGIEGMKNYRDTVSQYATDAGRDPEKIKILHLISPVLADTDDEARAKKKAQNEAIDNDIEGQLYNLSYITGIDFTKYDLDAPLPDVEPTVNGHQSSFAPVAAMARTGLPFREVLKARRGQETIELVGTPETVADQMEAAMEEVGGDGFKVLLPFTRKNVAEIADGLAPVLRRRGLIRDGYAHATLRENLQEF